LTGIDVKSDMRISRLFEMIHILLQKKTITSRQLSLHFDVSIRTIYRDIEILSSAGIPVYTNRGKGGGISILDNFILDKSLLSEQEQNNILTCLHGLKSVSFSETAPVLKKLSAFFNREAVNWIDVDFSYWGSSNSEREKFLLFKEAIINRNLLRFVYFGSSGEKTQRTVEPIRILFKNRNWYLCAFCRVKENFRIFKITRVKDLSLLNETFSGKVFKDQEMNFAYVGQNISELVLKIDAAMAYRVYDEFEEENIRKDADGNFIASVTFPEDEWLYGYVLSFGNYAEVLEPVHIRAVIKEKIEKMHKKYL
jgi:predicted DNA-binding transcriptional regulator YafY